VYGLFLIGGLILLAAAALLGPLAGFVRHLVGLTGLISLLRWIRLILLCHNIAPVSASAFHLRVRTVLILIRVAEEEEGCLPDKENGQRI
jgi:hypothetical protein